MRIKIRNHYIPVANITAIIAEMVVVEITNIPNSIAPIKIAVMLAKKIDKNPPTAIKDTWKETMITFNVAATKINREISNPANAKRVIVPTCGKMSKCQTLNVRHFIWQSYGKMSDIPDIQSNVEMFNHADQKWPLSKVCERRQLNWLVHASY